MIGILDGEGARVFEQSGAGLVCRAGDGAALADRALELAALAPSQRTAMGARGLEYSDREFDRDRLLMQLEDWMRGLAFDAAVRSGR